MGRSKHPDPVAQKAAERARSAAWYAANRERELARAKERNALPANRERNRTRAAAWYAANRERRALKIAAKRATDPEAFRAAARASWAKWRAKDLDHARRVMRRQVLKRYGLNLEQYERLWTDQRGCCGICGRPLVDGGRASDGVCVDHDQGNGRVRGLLCRRCNIRLAVLEDRMFTIPAQRYLAQVAAT